MNIFNELWNFVRDNVQIIVNGAYLILAVILLIARKKMPKSEKLSAIEPILDELPDMIQAAEDALGSKTGFSKLIYVLKLVQDKCVKSGLIYDENFWTEKIENILATPEKK